MSIWESWGFSRNPYDTEPVPSSEDGLHLLVGRDAEVMGLEDAITSASTVPILAGDNGVGKTSIALVAGFRLSTGRPGDYLLLPKRLQLSPSNTLDRFEHDTYQAVARALVDNEDYLEDRGIARADVDQLKRWLRSSESRARGGGLTTPFGGFTVSGSATQRDGSFGKDGLPDLINSWLEQCVSEGATTGVICVLDNLETLNESDDARAALEEARDGLLAQRGLRWVLCGTRDIVRSSATSSRMRGRLAKPTPIEPLSADIAPDIVARRLDLFGAKGSYVPVEPDAFRFVYHLLGRHLREALDYCQRFALFLKSHRHEPQGAADKRRLLEQWMARQADECAKDASRTPPRSRQLLRTLCEMGGAATHHDADVFGFADSAEMLIVAEALAAEELVTLWGRSEEGQEFHLDCTSSGWLTEYQRRGYATLPGATG